MWEEIADQHPALSTGLELPARLEQGDLLVAQPATHAGLFAVGLKQLGFEIERVHVRHAAIREDEDDPLRLRRKMRLFRSERIARVLGQQLREQARHEERAADKRAEKFTGVHGVMPKALDCGDSFTALRAASYLKAAKESPQSESLRRQNRLRCLVCQS